MVEAQVRRYIEMAGCFNGHAFYLHADHGRVHGHNIDVAGSQRGEQGLHRIQFSLTSEVSHDIAVFNA
jgi:hypothetical protein